jgi:hypothetical protein
MTSTWLHSLPRWLMALVAFGATFLAGAVIYFGKQVRTYLRSASGQRKTLVVLIRSSTV